MAEREEAREADEQVERAGKEGEAEDPHEEDRVDQHRRRERGEEEQAVGDVCAVDGHRSRPNSPAGRTRRTIAMSTNTTVAEAWGQKTLHRPSMRPRARPPTIEPRIDPMPPMTTTANTVMMRFEPMSGLTFSAGA